jgi:omega-6 fatty acid desaturase (delta-12 desaturase)
MLASSPSTASGPVPIPPRRLIRSWLVPLSQRSTARALMLVATDVLLLAACMALATLPGLGALQVLAGLLGGFVIGRLFILGHDACHQSFTRHRSLNRWIGRFVFLPSLTPYSLWEVGHNVVHHGYTNLKGFDFVWEPLTVEAYGALPRWRQALERVYRSGWAPGLYYFVEVWWKRLWFPSARTMPTRRPVFFWDSLLVSVFALLWMGVLWAWAEASGQSAAWLLFTGFVLPFAAWNALIGFVVYVHHTHTGVAWYADKTTWAAKQPFVSTTVHLTFRSAMGTVLHHIMEHTAHHVDMGVPLYRLKAAQKLLEERLPGHIVIQPFSWRWYADTARCCKLYDVGRGAWLDFNGRPTVAAHRGSH